MIVSWLSTNECNLTCSHCYQDAGEKSQAELSTSEAKRMINDIAAAGFKIMIFSGGEPLIRPDIYELVDYARAAGLRPVFGTNGMLLTKDVVQKLKDCGATAMGISLDSLDPSKHNGFRGNKNAHRLTLNGIANCAELGLPFQIHTTVLNWNRNEILDITDFAIQAGAVGHYIFFLIPVGRGIYIEKTSLEVLENEALLTEIIKKQNKTGLDIRPVCAPQFMRIASQLGINMPRASRGCLAGISYCIISPVGKVRPCAYMVEEAGDIRQSGFLDIWKTSQLFMRLRSQEYSGNCGSCKYGKICGGCRARAGYYHNGDFMATDRYCVFSSCATAL